MKLKISSDIFLKLPSTKKFTRTLWNYFEGGGNGREITISVNLLDIKMTLTENRWGFLKELGLFEKMAKREHPQSHPDTLTPVEPIPLRCMTS